MLKTLSALLGIPLPASDAPGTQQPRAVTPTVTDQEKQKAAESQNPPSKKLSSAAAEMGRKGGKARAQKAKRVEPIEALRATDPAIPPA
jgi:hypothetical protein